MPAIHELLADTERQCQALVKEMEAFRSARSLNEAATVGLESTCAALEETAKAIRPFSETRVRRLTIIVVSSAILNVVLVVTTVILLLIMK